MPWLKALSLRQKLILLTTPLLLAILLYAFFSMRQMYDASAASALTHTLAELSRHQNAVVHELQKERGNTGGFYGSGGKQFVSELAAQRSKTDTALDAYRQYLGTVTADIENMQIQKSLAEIDRQLDRLEMTRERMQSMTEALDVMLPFLASLTPEQRAEMKELMEERRERRRGHWGWGWGWGWGHGGGHMGWAN